MANEKNGFVPQENKIYTLQELAGKFHCSRQTMKKWLLSTGIGCIRVGNNYFLHGNRIHDYFYYGRNIGSSGSRIDRPIQMDH